MPLPPILRSMTITGVNHHFTTKCSNFLGRVQDACVTYLFAPIFFTGPVDGKKRLLPLVMVVPSIYSPCLCLGLYFIVHDLLCKGNCKWSFDPSSPMILSIKSFIIIIKL